MEDKKTNVTVGSGGWVKLKVSSIELNIATVDPHLSNRKRGRCFISLLDITGNI